MDTKPIVKFFFIVISLALLIIFIIFFLIIPKVRENRVTPQLNSSKTGEITNFAECIAAGNPAMESYPRQCRANNKTFVEEIENNFKDMACDGSVDVCLREITCADGSVVEDSEVCGKIIVQCIKAPCPPIEQTFSNRCEAIEHSAINIRNGECDDQLK